jgi:ABC-type multidrug transport system ATPase subunit
MGLRAYSVDDGPPGPAERGAARGALEKTYADGTRGLRGLSMTIPAGSFFGLLGPNGSGKSTLIGMVSGLVRAPAGRIWVFGQTSFRVIKRG